MRPELEPPGFIQVEICLVAEERGLAAVEGDAAHREQLLQLIPVRLVALAAEYGADGLVALDREKRIHAGNVHCNVVERHCHAAVLDALADGGVIGFQPRLRAAVAAARGVKRVGRLRSGGRGRVKKADTAGKHLEQRGPDRRHRDRTGADDSGGRGQRAQGGTAAAGVSAPPGRRGVRRALFVFRLFDPGKDGGGKPVEFPGAQRLFGRAKSVQVLQGAQRIGIKVPHGCGLLSLPAGGAGAAARGSAAY